MAALRTQFGPLSNRGSVITRLVRVIQLGPRIKRAMTKVGLYFHPVFPCSTAFANGSRTCAWSPGAMALGHALFPRQVELGCPVCGRTASTRCWRDATQNRDAGRHDRDQIPARGNRADMAVLRQVRKFSGMDLRGGPRALSKATKSPDLRGFRKPGCAGRTSEDGYRMQTQRDAVKPNSEKKRQSENIGL
jgi:hypothetical protein